MKKEGDIIPIQILLYVLAAKYIFGSNKLTGMVSKLSGSTKNAASSLMTDPHKMENMISMVRTFVPLTSSQTVSKVNTYLPAMEKVSTLLGMYSFLNRAQNFRPLESLEAKTTVEKMSALMKNGNIPVGKMLAQPIIANNMEKMMGTMAVNMLKNGNFNDMLSSMTNQSSGSNQTESSKNFDLNSLMETFMPLINNLSTNSQAQSKDVKQNDRSSDINIKASNSADFKNEFNLTDDVKDLEDHKKTGDEKFANTDRNENHKPVRIKQRKRRQNGNE